MQYIGNNEIAAKYVGDTEIQKQYVGDTLVWEKQQPAPSGPPNNEIWYTTSDGQTITPSGLSPTSNVYSGGKGVMTFSSPVTSIPESAFSNQLTLMSVVCPSSVTTLNSTILQYSTCTAFTAEYVTSFAGHHTFMDATGLTSYKNNVATNTNWIGMFERCYNFESVEMTACTNFQQSCFANCGSLISIKLGATPPSWYGFYGMPNNGTLYVPTAAVSTYESWKSGKMGISNWTVVGY